MATQNFSAMTTKKLQALMQTANEADCAQIKTILEARTQKAVGKEQVAYEAEEPLTEAEEAMLAAAEAGEATGEATTQESTKMTDEDRDKLAEECKANVNHKCQVVPFNTIDWVEGVIMGVVNDKRSNKVLYAIKTEEGKRIVKVYNSTLLKILEEVVEPVRKARAKSEAGEKTEWSEEAIEAAWAETLPNVGKLVSYPISDEDNAPMQEGRIVAIVPEKRAHKMLYRIEVVVAIEGQPNTTKLVHKVSTLPSLVMPETFDEVGAALNEKYLVRRANIATKSPATPESKVLAAEESLKKAEESLKKAQETFELRKAALETAKAELDAHLASQTQEESLA